MDMQTNFNILFMLLLSVNMLFI